MDSEQFFEVTIPPETDLLFKRLKELKEQLSDKGHQHTLDELYDDLPTRAYFMMRVFDELNFCTLYPADGK